MTEPQEVQYSACPRCSGTVATDSVSDLTVATCVVCGWEDYKQRRVSVTPDRMRKGGILAGRPKTSGKSTQKRRSKR
jgi:hypothetical protein